MKTPLITVLVLLLSYSTYAQHSITGTLLNTKGKTITGANIYLDGTYDGTTSDAEGNFSFQTTLQGTQTLTVSFVSYETYYQSIDLPLSEHLNITLEAASGRLEEVVLTRKDFNRIDNAKVATVTTMDIISTAGAVGDVIGALQTLPGTSNNAEDGRLFVRGGRAEETQIFIDGMRVFSPYTPTPNNVPARGRYSPFLFEGISLSTGGFSAEYGQALSSVLQLNTINSPTQTETNIGIHNVGASLGHTKKWDKRSLSFNTAYINAGPYSQTFDNRNEWNDPYQNFQGEAVFRNHYEHGTLKLYTAFDITDFDVDQEDINFEELVNNKVTNQNLYFNGSYQGKLGNGWSLHTGASISNGKNDIFSIDTNVDLKEQATHLKAKVGRRFSGNLELNIGAEHFYNHYEEQIDRAELNTDTNFDDHTTAAFTELNIGISDKLNTRMGIRAEHASMINKSVLSPRLATAYELSPDSQLSLGYGYYYQKPLNQFLIQNTSVSMERSDQWNLNYQWEKDFKTIRAEFYHKKYRDLITFDQNNNGTVSNLSNDGSGFANGIDLFWRDRSSVKNLDYWLTYSFIDSERQFLDFKEDITPDFAPKHNLSLVGKYFIEKWTSQVGLTYNFATGRTYTNPNTNTLLGEQTPNFNALNLSWAYLLTPQKILYLSVSNALDNDNIFGYQYANTPNANGHFDRRALRQATDQFIFVGFFWTISDDKSSNQLDNL